jgi:hypothetical protein
VTIALHGGKTASQDALSTLEKLIHHALSPAVRRFVTSEDGAKPDPNIFLVDGQNESGINEFIPVSVIPRELKLIGSLPRHAYPIARAEGGNFIIIDEASDGGVFFLDHEEYGSPLTKLAKNLEDFLNKLEPFDIQSVEIKPGQVKSVWIDPAFLAQLNKKPTKS